MKRYKCLSQEYAIAPEGGIITVKRGVAYDPEGDQISNVDVDYIEKSEDFMLIETGDDKEPVKVDEAEETKKPKKEQSEGKTPEKYYCLVKSVGKVFTSQEEAEAEALVGGADCILVEILKQFKIEKKLITTKFGGDNE